MVDMQRDALKGWALYVSDVILSDESLTFSRNAMGFWDYSLSKLN